MTITCYRVIFCWINLLLNTTWFPNNQDAIIKHSDIHQFTLSTLQKTVTVKNVTNYSSQIKKITESSGNIDTAGLDAIANALKNIVEVAVPTEEV